MFNNVLLCCLVGALGGVHYQQIWLDAEVKIMWIYSMVMLAYTV